MFRNPLFADVLAIRDTVDRLLNDNFGDDRYWTAWSRNSGTANAKPMPLDVYATDDQAVILAAVPGMQPENLDLSVHQNTVTLSGKIDSATNAQETKEATWYMHELWGGEVRRSVTLPFPVDADHAEARFENGILRVVLPKAESAKPRKIAISGGTGSQTAIGSGTQGSS